MGTAEGRGAAHARAALAGNPSDGYGGAVLAFTFAEQHARAIATPARTPAVDPPAALVTATVNRFANEFAPAARDTAITWSTDIPRGVGLGGSSAIIIATLRALSDLHDVSIDRRRLAALALAIETVELGIAAGLQDRVAQTHGGLTFMDFGPEHASGGDRHGHYERLHPASLPALLVAWCTDASEDSGGVSRGG
jgi:glucuronokinase